jgi:hypothetical protein
MKFLGWLLSLIWSLITGRPADDAARSAERLGKSEQINADVNEVINDVAAANKIKDSVEVSGGAAALDDLHKHWTRPD